MKRSFYTWAHILSSSTHSFASTSLSLLLCSCFASVGTRVEACDGYGSGGRDHVACGGAMTRRSSVPIQLHPPARHSSAAARTGSEARAGGGAGPLHVISIEESLLSKKLFGRASAEFCRESVLEALLNAPLISSLVQPTKSA